MTRQSWSSVLAAGLLLLLSGCSQSKSDAPSTTAPDIQTPESLGFNEKALTVRLDGTELHVTAPLDVMGTPQTTGTLRLELRHLDGTLVDQVERTVAYGHDVVQFVLRGLPEDITPGGLVAYRLDYSGALATGPQFAGKRSVFDALETIQVVLMTDDALHSGGEGAFTAFILDPTTGRPLPGAEVRATLDTDSGASSEVVVMADEAGRATGALPVPDTQEGAKLTLTVTSGTSATVVEVPVTLERPLKLFLTTDKPLYQPGQTIHIRTLTLGAADKAPAGDEDVVYEVEDARGNKVGKILAHTDAYGVAFTEFRIATEVNVGQWKVRALQGGVTSEKTLTVEHYTLPKFKVAATLDRTWYRPGEAVQVTGDARYFFGKPVAGGHVTLEAAVFDVAFTPFANLEATTSAEGTFSFTLALPEYIVGLPIDQGGGLVKLALTVTDTADHPQTAEIAVTVAKGSVDAVLVPESGQLAPGIPNDIYVVTSDPVGAPVSATVRIASEGVEIATVTTDALGLGTVSLVPTAGGALKLDLDVETDAETVTLTRTLGVSEDTAAVLLRTDKAVYRTGETVQGVVLVGEAKERIYLDAIGKGRTLDVRRLTVIDGRAEFAYDLDPGMEGEVTLAAYYITDSGSIVRDQKLLFVQPADELTLEMTPEKASYRPGEDAKVRLVVSDKEGKGVPAAIGLQVVDEAVFALTESQPGLLKVFFDLARELAQPHYQLKDPGMSAKNVVATDLDTLPGQDKVAYDQKAKVAFAALGEMPVFAVERDTHRESVLKASAVLKPLIAAERDAILTDLSALMQSGVLTDENVATWLATAWHRMDFWDHPWAATWDPEMRRVTLTSPGPDEKPDTADDLTITFDLWEVRWRQHGWENGDFDGMAGGGPAAGGGGPVPGVPGDTKNDDGGGEPVRVRQNFPETLLVAPSIITDSEGRAQLDVTMADSITTWRMTGIASSAAGRVGSGVGGILVFQDFFADIAFPTAITRGDAFQVPVAVYNYLDTTQTVILTVEAADWFALEGGDALTLTLAPGEVKGASFGIRATKVGVHGLTVIAQGTALSDAVKRTVRVEPDGKEFTVTRSARFATSPDGITPATDLVAHDIDIPEGNIDGAQRLTVKVYPGYSSQVVEGMDSMLQLPNGCFEQTTSSAWPNVLATEYMQTVDQITPEVELKAREYIAAGYQRLVTFECATGGYNWWVGDDPGNAILTAMAVMMFSDTKRVAYAEQAVIDRAAKWLADHQQSDGSWTEEAHLHAGNENLGASSVRATAYIAWALAATGQQPAAVQQALGYVKAGLDSETDVYTLAMATLAIATGNPGDALLGALAQRLHDARVEEGGQIHWTPGQATMVQSWGDNADIETTAVVALALMEVGAFSADVDGGIAYLVSHKDPQGNWGYSTQATVLALKALIKSLGATAQKTAATVTVLLNGVPVGERTFTDFDADVLWQLELADKAVEGKNTVQLQYAGLGNFTYQVTGAYYLPWMDVEPEISERLTIDVAYDKTHLAVDDTIGVTVSVANNDPAATGQVMVDLGLPPGFDLDTTGLVQAKQAGIIQTFERTALQLIVYLGDVPYGQPATFSYGLVALYPLEAAAPKSEAYFYYNKSEKSESPPVALTVE